MPSEGIYIYRDWMQWFYYGIKGQCCSVCKQSN